MFTQGHYTGPENLEKEIPSSPGMNICPKKSETVYWPIWGILKLSGVLNQKILKLSIRGIPYVCPEKDKQTAFYSPLKQLLMSTAACSFVIGDDSWHCEFRWSSPKFTMVKCRSWRVLRQPGAGSKLISNLRQESKNTFRFFWEFFLPLYPKS